LCQRQVSAPRTGSIDYVTTDSEWRITRIIARLNIGGPAIQAITLTHLLEQHGYHTRLIRGQEGPEEGNMDHLAVELGVRPTLVREMRRDPGPGDLLALWRLIRLLRQDRPHIIHTHAAKAGTLGRVAALIAFPRRSTRPPLVHTYHGHSLTGYFSGRTAALYRIIERILARFTDRLLAVSPEVRDDLIELRVAERTKFEIVALGLDLRRFADDAARVERRNRLRSEWGVPSDAKLVTLVARLVPIKRVDRFLRVARRLSEDPGVHFAVVGDGELRERLQSSPEAVELQGRLTWTGFRSDIPDVCVASDLVMLTSDNEGTPVSLIEAQAAAVPVVGTDVGGVRSAVLEGATGLLVAPSDEAGLAAAAARLLENGALAEQMARRARENAIRLFSVERLVFDLDRLYRTLLRVNE
jgi:glycosyltransferase involved in cell wall biosynthesis